MAQALDLPVIIRAPEFTSIEVLKPRLQPRAANSTAATLAHSPLAMPRHCQ